MTMLNTLYTSDEVLHRQAAQASQRLRYLKPRAEDPRRVLARTFEDDVAGRLADRGYHVVRTGHNDPFDLLVNGLRVEVKAATWSGNRYQAALRSNAADVLMFGLFVSLDVRVYFVIPWPEVIGLTHIKISNADPEAYTGRWRPYLEAWGIIDALIAQGINHWQIPFPEAL